MYHLPIGFVSFPWNNYSIAQQRVFVNTKLKKILMEFLEMFSSARAMVT
jgi:hypothetical protein